MHNLLLVTPLLLALASAAPSRERHHHLKNVGHFSVTNVAHRQTRNRDPSQALSQAYTKFDLSSSTADDDRATVSDRTDSSGSDPQPSTAETKRLSGSQAGQVDTTSAGVGDVEYLSPVTIGGQTMMMDFDTGSSDFWVFSTQLDSAAAAGHTLYDPAKSKTWKPMAGYSFFVSYGDASSISGDLVGTDVVSIGGITVENQAVELANKVSTQFTRDTASNGLVGLGFGTINTVKPHKQKTFLESIKDDLTEQVFTASLKHNATGTYTFGKIDSAQHNGELVYTEAKNLKGHWAFDSPGFAVGDGPFMTDAGASPAIADTGTSLLLMDDRVVQGYYAQVAGAQYSAAAKGWTYPCSTKLPDLHISIGPEYANTIPSTVMTFVELRDGSCYGALQSNNGGGLQILGDILFKAQFVAFDIGNMRIGFADHA